MTGVVCVGEELIFSDSFTEGGGSNVNLQAHLPNIDLDPSGLGWLGDNAAFEISKVGTNPPTTPSGLGDGVAGDQNQGQGVVVQHGITGKKRITFWLGNDPTIGAVNSLYQGVIVRKKDDPVDLVNMDNDCVILIHVRLATSRLSLMRFYKTGAGGFSGGTFPGGSTALGTASTAGPSIDGTWQQIVVEDDGSNLTAWIVGDEGNTCDAVDTDYAGSEYSGMIRVENTGNNGNKFRNDFAVYQL